MNQNSLALGIYLVYFCYQPICAESQLGTFSFLVFPVLRSRTSSWCHWRLKCVSNRSSQPSLTTWLTPWYVRLKPPDRLQTASTSHSGCIGCLWVPVVWGRWLIREHSRHHYRILAVMAAGLRPAIPPSANAAVASANPYWRWQVVRRDPREAEATRVFPVAVFPSPEVQIASAARDDTAKPDSARELDVRVHRFHRIDFLGSCFVGFVTVRSRSRLGMLPRMNRAQTPPTATARTIESEPAPAAERPTWPLASPTQQRSRPPTEEPKHELH